MIQTIQLNLIFKANIKSQTETNHLLYRPYVLYSWEQISQMQVGVIYLVYCHVF